MTPSQTPQVRVVEYEKIKHESSQKHLAKMFEALQ